MKKLSFNNGKPIGPYSNIEWPGEFNSPLYWTATRTFTLDDKPVKSSLIIAADRHYEIYINGKHTVKYRNFFNGDEYIYAQDWLDESIDYLTAGENTIDIIIRSDPWNNKNYRCLYPLIILKLEVEYSNGCGAQIISDSQWKTAVIKGWREQIDLGLCGTIHFEKITSRSTSFTFLPPHLEYTDACEISWLKVPEIYLWTDKPHHINKYEPLSMVSSGTCHFIEQALEVDGIMIDKILKESKHYILTASFETKDPAILSIATTYLYRHSIEINGESVYESDDATGRHQMILPGYLIPLGKFTLKKGVNTLTIKILEKTRVNTGYRLAIRGIEELFNPDVWSDGNGTTPEMKIVTLAPSEMTSANIVDNFDNAVQLNEGEILATSSEGKNLFAVMDMGKLINGSLMFKINSESSGRIYVSYGFNYKYGVVDCDRMKLRMTDIIDVPQGESIYEAFDIRTFKYLNMIFNGFKGNIEISSIRAEESVYFNDDASSLSSSDGMLDSIWKASMNTMRLCWVELLIDNPEREHGQWHDPVLSLSTSGYYVAGCNALKKIVKVLEEFTLTRQPDGQIAGYTPGKWFPRIPLQCHMALFILECYYYFMYTGDEVFTAKSYDVITGILEYWEKHRNSEGLITDLHTVWVDWGSHIYSYGRGSSGSTGALTSMNAYYFGCLHKAAEIADYLGKPSEAVQFRQIASDVRSAMHRRLYDVQLGLFRDGYGDPEAERHISQTSNSLTVLFGIVPEEQKKKIIERVFAPDASLNDKLIPANAIFVWQSACAMFEAGCGKLALDWMRKGYGTMIQKEYPGTLWEIWQPYASQCQATGVAPVYLLSRYVAGIYPTMPGFSEIGINPVASGLQWLRTVLNTVHGVIEASWELNKNGKLNYNITLPESLKNSKLILGNNINLNL